MSSVTMAADSTQADFIHHRVAPVGKAALARPGFRRGRQQQQGHQRDRSRSRFRSSSSRSQKPKRHGKEREVKKVRRHRNGGRSRSHDDTSDRDSDLDLSKDLLPISGYVRIKDEMIDHMFRSISNRKLRAMLPEILRSLSSDELKTLCMEQLEVMSKKRICRILGGADPEMISSSGTEEYDDDEEDEGSSERSNDVENDGPDVGSAYAENEAVNSTSLIAVADLLVKDCNVTNHRENDDDKGSDRIDNPAINSVKNNDRSSAVYKVVRDCHAGDGDGGITDGKVEVEGEEASTVPERVSRVDHRELDGDEIFGITIKINEARFGMEDPDASADAGGGCSQEESMKMNKRNIERSYRTKQLDDDERENDSDGGGRRNVSEGVGAGVAHSKPKAKNKEELSDSESIPTSLPNLDTEPEETCSPYVFLDTKLNQELKKSAELDQRNPSSGKISEATFPTESTESKESGTDCGLICSQGGKISPLDQSNCPDGVTVMHLTGNTREQQELVVEAVQDVPEIESKDKSRKRTGSPPQLRTLPSIVESTNDGEEMIIEIHEHEFSDDVGSEGDASFERDRESERKKGSDSVRDDKILTEMQQRKDAKGSDEQRTNEEGELNEDKRLCSSEKLEMENNRGLSTGEDNGKPAVPGRPKAPEGEQRPTKRKSVEIADERLQSKMQKIGKAMSEERSEATLEQKKCAKTRNSGIAEGKAAPASKADIEAENRTSAACFSDACHRSESGGNSGASTSLPAPKRDASLVPSPAEQKTSKSQSKMSQASSSEDASSSSRKVIRTGNQDVASSARARVERAETQISSSRVESSEHVDASARLTTPKLPNRMPSHQKLSPSARASSSETGKEPAMPVLSKTQLEILELEMRARAIKAMLKAQEELEKREEKVKMDEKRRSVIPSTAQLPRVSQAVEGRGVIRTETKMIRIGTGHRGEAAAGPKTTPGVETAQRVVTTPRQSQDKRSVERRPAASPAEGVPFSRTVQSGQAGVTRQGFKSFRDVVASGKLPISASRFVKRPLASATRGRRGGGANSSCTGSRIVWFSGGPRGDNRSVVPTQRPTPMRQTSGGPDKTAKMAGGDREDVRRVVASSLVSARALKGADDPLRYGHRDRAHGPSPSRDQKRSVVAGNRRGGSYKQQVSKASRF